MIKQGEARISYLMTDCDGAVWRWAWSSSWNGAVWLRSNKGPTMAPGRVSPCRLPPWQWRCHRGRGRRRGRGHCRGHHLVDLHRRWVRVLRAALPSWPPFCPSARELIRREMEAMTAAYCQAVLGRGTEPSSPHGKKRAGWENKERTAKQ